MSGLCWLFIWRCDFKCFCYMLISRRPIGGLLTFQICTVYVGGLIRATPTY
jgi:hypothetical protein